MSRLQALVAGDLELQQITRQSDGADLLRQIDVCRLLGVSDQTWMRWRKEGRVPTPITLPSGRLRWRRADIDALLGKPVSRPGRRRYFAKGRAVQGVAGRHV